MKKILLLVVVFSLTLILLPLSFIVDAATLTCNSGNGYAVNDVGSGFPGEELEVRLDGCSSVSLHSTTAKSFKLTGAGAIGSMSITLKSLKCTSTDGPTFLGSTISYCINVDVVLGSNVTFIIDGLTIETLDGITFDGTGYMQFTGVLFPRTVGRISGAVTPPLTLNRIVAPKVGISMPRDGSTASVVLVSFQTLTVGSEGFAVTNSYIKTDYFSGTRRPLQLHAVSIASSVITRGSIRIDNVAIFATAVSSSTKIIRASLLSFSIGTPSIAGDLTLSNSTLHIQSSASDAGASMEISALYSNKKLQCSSTVTIDSVQVMWAPVPGQGTALRDIDLRGLHCASGVEKLTALVVHNVSLLQSGGNVSVSKGSLSLTLVDFYRQSVGEVAGADPLLRVEVVDSRILASGTLQALDGNVQINVLRAMQISFYKGSDRGEKMLRFQNIVVRVAGELLAAGDNANARMHMLRLIQYSGNYGKIGYGTALRIQDVHMSATSISVAQSALAKDAALALMFADQGIGLDSFIVRNVQMIILDTMSAPRTSEVRGVWFGNSGRLMTSVMENTVFRIGRRLHAGTTARVTLWRSTGMGRAASSGKDAMFGVFNLTNCSFESGLPDDDDEASQSSRRPTVFSSSGVDIALISVGGSYFSSFNVHDVHIRPASAGAAALDITADLGDLSLALGKFRLPGVRVISFSVERCSVTLGNILKTQNHFTALVIDTDSVFGMIPTPPAAADRGDFVVSDVFLRLGGGSGATTIDVIHSGGSVFSAGCVHLQGGSGVNTGGLDGFRTVRFHNVTTYADIRVNSRNAVDINNILFSPDTRMNDIEQLSFQSCSVVLSDGAAAPNKISVNVVWLQAAAQSLSLFEYRDCHVRVMGAEGVNSSSSDVALHSLLTGKSLVAAPSGGKFIIENVYMDSVGGRADGDFSCKGAYILSLQRWTEILLEDFIVNSGAVEAASMHIVGAQLFGPLEGPAATAQPKPGAATLSFHKISVSVNKKISISSGSIGKVDVSAVIIQNRHEPGSFSGISYSNIDATVHQGIAGSAQASFLLAGVRNVAAGVAAAAGSYRPTLTIRDVSVAIDYKADGGYHVDGTAAAQVIGVQFAKRLAPFSSVLVENLITGCRFRTAGGASARCYSLQIGSSGSDVADIEVDSFVVRNIMADVAVSSTSVEAEMVWLRGLSSFSSFLFDNIDGYFMVEEVLATTFCTVHGFYADSVVTAAAANAITTRFSVKNVELFNPDVQAGAGDLRLEAVSFSESSGLLSADEILVEDCSITYAKLGFGSSATSASSVWLHAVRFNNISRPGRGGGSGGGFVQLVDCKISRVDFSGFSSQDQKIRFHVAAFNSVSPASDSTTFATFDLKRVSLGVFSSLPSTDNEMFVAAVRSIVLSDATSTMSFKSCSISIFEASQAAILSPQSSSASSSSSSSSPSSCVTRVATVSFSKSTVSITPKRSDICPVVSIALVQGVALDAVRSIEVNGCELLLWGSAYPNNLRMALIVFSSSVVGLRKISISGSTSNVRDYVLTETASSTSPRAPTGASIALIAFDTGTTMSCHDLQIGLTRSTISTSMRVVVHVGTRGTMLPVSTSMRYVLVDFANFSAVVGGSSTLSGTTSISMDGSRVYADCSDLVRGDASHIEMTLAFSFLASAVEQLPTIASVMEVSIMNVTVTHSLRLQWSASAPPANTAREHHHVSRMLFGESLRQAAISVVDGKIISNRSLDSLSLSAPGQKSPATFDAAAIVVTGTVVASSVVVRGTQLECTPQATLQLPMMPATDDAGVEIPRLVTRTAIVRLGGNVTDFCSLTVHGSVVDETGNFAISAATAQSESTLLFRSTIEAVSIEGPRVSQTVFDIQRVTVQPSEAFFSIVGSGSGNVETLVRRELVVVAALRLPAPFLGAGEDRHGTRVQIHNCELSLGASIGAAAAGAGAGGGGGGRPATNGAVSVDATLLQEVGLAGELAATQAWMRARGWSLAKEQGSTSVSLRNNRLRLRGIGGCATGGDAAAAAEQSPSAAPNTAFALNASLFRLSPFSTVPAAAVDMGGNSLEARQLCVAADSASRIAAVDFSPAGGRAASRAELAFLRGEIVGGHLRGQVPLRLSGIDMHVGPDVDIGQHHRASTNSIDNSRKQSLISMFLLDPVAQMQLSPVNVTENSLLVVVRNSTAADQQQQQQQQQQGTQRDVRPTASLFAVSRDSAVPGDFVESFFPFPDAAAAAAAAGGDFSDTVFEVERNSAWVVTVAASAANDSVFSSFGAPGRGFGLLGGYQPVADDKSADYTSDATNSLGLKHSGFNIRCNEWLRGHGRDPHLVHAAATVRLDCSATPSQTMTGTNTSTPSQSRSESPSAGSPSETGESASVTTRTQRPTPSLSRSRSAEPTNDTASLSVSASADVSRTASRSQLPECAPLTTLYIQTQQQHQQQQQSQSQQNNQDDEDGESLRMTSLKQARQASLIVELRQRDPNDYTRLLPREATASGRVENPWTTFSVSNSSVLAKFLSVRHSRPKASSLKPGLKTQEQRAAEEKGEEEGVYGVNGNLTLQAVRRLSPTRLHVLVAVRRAAGDRDMALTLVLSADALSCRLSNGTAYAEALAWAMKERNKLLRLKGGSGSSGNNVSSKIVAGDVEPQLQDPRLSVGAAAAARLASNTLLYRRAASFFPRDVVEGLTTTAYAVSAVAALAARSPASMLAMQRSRRLMDVFGCAKPQEVDPATGETVLPEDEPLGFLSNPTGMQLGDPADGAPKPYSRGTVLGNLLLVGGFSAASLALSAISMMFDNSRKNDSSSSSSSKPSKKKKGNKNTTGSASGEGGGKEEGVETKSGWLCFSFKALGAGYFPGVIFTVTLPLIDGFVAAGYTLLTHPPRPAPQGPDWFLGIAAFATCAGMFFYFGKQMLPRSKFLDRAKCKPVPPAELEAAAPRRIDTFGARACAKFAWFFSGQAEWVERRYRPPKHKPAEATTDLEQDGLLAAFGINFGENGSRNGSNDEDDAGASEMMILAPSASAAADSSLELTTTIGAGAGAGGDARRLHERQQRREGRIPQPRIYFVERFGSVFDARQQHFYWGDYIEGFVSFAMALAVVINKVVDAAACRVIAAFVSVLVAACLALALQFGYVVPAENAFSVFANGVLVAIGILSCVGAYRAEQAENLTFAAEVLNMALICYTLLLVPAKLGMNIDEWLGRYYPKIRAQLCAKGRRTLPRKSVKQHQKELKALFDEL